jgi:hypothetical protein
MAKNPVNINTNKELLRQLFISFTTGIRSAKAVKAKEWLEQKGLSYYDLQIGYNSGQFHHRKSEEFKQKYLQLGVLKPSDVSVNAKDLKAYACFGGYSVVFPLKDEHGDIINLYAIRMDAKTHREEYLNDEGIYPAYPNPLTKRLYICSSVVDTASLLQSKTLENKDAVISLFNGTLKEQHLQAINKLNHLEEIIFIQ